MTLIYTHRDCTHYATTPLRMLAHIRTTHPEISSPLNTTAGLEILDTLLSEHTMHTTPPGVLKYVCTKCQILHPSRFSAESHLSIPEHIDDLARAIEESGDTGIAALFERRWIRAMAHPAAGPSSQGVLPQNVTNNYATEQYFNAPIHTLSVNAMPPRVLQLEISEYTTREEFPEVLQLQVVAAPGTRTVAALAEAIDDAFVGAGGKRGKIAWIDMIEDRGIEMRGRLIYDDRDVVEWMAEDGEEGKSLAFLRG